MGTNKSGVSATKRFARTGIGRRRGNQSAAHDVEQVETEGDYEPDATDRRTAQEPPSLRAPPWQSEFRNKMLKRFGGECAITGCRVD